MTLTVSSPSETLEIGKVFDYNVNIDTEGAKVADQDFDIDCDPRYSQFVDLVKGEFFDNVEFTPPGADGKIMATGKMASAKEGSGDAAITGQKIIAEAPTGTALCAVSLVVPGSGSVSASVTPRPLGGGKTETTLPRSGVYDSFFTFLALGMGATAAGIYFKRKTY